MKPVKRPKVITSVTVPGETKPRRVFYVRRELLFDKAGRVCRTPLELAHCLQDALDRRDADAVHSIVWDALNFIHGGKVPADWAKEAKRIRAVPLAI
jgi:hypothetical protein